MCQGSDKNLSNLTLPYLTLSLIFTEFPKFADGSPGTANFTSNYVYGSGYPTLDVRGYKIMECQNWKRHVQGEKVGDKDRERQR